MRNQPKLLQRSECLSQVGADEEGVGEERGITEGMRHR